MSMSRSLNGIAGSLVRSLWLLAVTVLISSPGYGQAGTCLASKLQLQFTTGSDDLRGDFNNLDVEVHFADHSVQTAQNVNQGKEWGGGSFNSVYVPLQQPVSPSQITQIVLIHSAQAGMRFNGTAPPFPVVPLSQDNWDMSQVNVIAIGSGVDSVIATAGPYRFTGNNPTFSFNVNPPVTCLTGTITQLQFTFSTADDDLRGGNDNLNIIVHSGDGGPDQVETNVNHSAGWSNGSTHEANIFLNRANTVQSVTLQTTFSGGTNGDNWNMGSAQIVGIGIGIHQNLATAGFHRFTGPPGNSLLVPITGWPPAPFPTVSGGPSQCRPDDTSAYCRNARMTRAQPPTNNGALLPVGTTQGLGSVQPGSAGALKPQITLNSQPATLLSNHNTPPTAAEPRTGLSPTESRTQNTLTNADVITMVKSGTPEPNVIERIQSAQHKFDLSTSGCRDLLVAGVKTNVLKAMGDGSVVPCAEPARSGVRTSSSR